MLEELGTHDQSRTTGIPVVDRAQTNLTRIAILSDEGVFTYEQLVEASARVASELLQGSDDLCEARVAFLARPGFTYVAMQWGIWMAGGIAVPLSLFHPRPELQYVVEDTDAEILMAVPELGDRVLPMARDLGRRFVLGRIREDQPTEELPHVDPCRRAMIIYTSGTTGKPKGVVFTHDAIRTQIDRLINAWEWSHHDRILLVLPLHHMHGILNVTLCSLWAGAQCHMMAGFDAKETLNRIAQGNLTLFMAVPTVYVKLIRAWEDAPAELRERMSAGCKNMRLMVSGSAALPARVLEKWEQISGHVLLERYGTTEIGMALSNPLHGERRAGHVGQPFPDVELRLVDEDGREVDPARPGEIVVRGPGQFLEYWGKPETTAQSFRDGWFRTGDIAEIRDGSYAILGRSSVDIIKSGGYKISALEIEEVLSEHPNIEEVAIVGIEDDEWGERVCAALVLRPESDLTLESLRAWSKERLAAYKAPTRMIRVDRLPRNPLGKLVKPEIVEFFRGLHGSERT
jgi:malonyl-CoA/methylmalonyl-CoA synthetase